MDRILDKIYHSSNHPASFSSVRKLYLAARIKEPSIKLRDVKEYLSSQDDYTLHRRVVRKFQRLPIVASHVDAIWQADLADVTHLAKYNDGHTFLLIAVDVLSRYVFAQPLTNKTSLSVSNGFQVIFKERKPECLQTDQGKEFVSKEFQTFLRGNGVKHYTTTSDDPKAAIAERFIRTLREKMAKFMRYSLSSRYIDQLDDFVSSYNNSVHSRLKMKPIEVTKFNERKAYRNLYGTFKPSMHHLNVGDKIRIAQKKDTFAKGSDPNFTEEIFVIKSKVKGKKRPVYKIEDLAGEAITSVHYPEEIVKVSKKMDDKYIIEKVIQEKKIAGKKHLLVKWKGYPAKFNSWILSDTIK